MRTETKDDSSDKPPETKETELSGTNPSTVFTELESNPSSTKPSQKKLFFIKVYVTLTLQLSVTMVLCLLSTFVKEVRLFMIHYSWTGVISLTLFAVSIFLLLLCQDLIFFPFNAIFLTILGLLGSWPLAVVAAIYDSIAVVSALGITLMVATITTIIAAIIPCAANSRALVFVFAVTIIAVTTSITSMIAYVVKMRTLHLLFSSLTALAASVYYFFITLFVMKSIHKVPPDWIFANLALYTTIPGLIIHLLVVLGELLK